MRLKHVKKGTNTDIQRQILAALPSAVEQVEPIAHKFKGANNTDTARNVWKFLRNQMSYEADAGTQTIKLPSALLRTRKGDCKSYTLFAYAVLTSLGIPNRVRYTGYSKTSRVPSHVYSMYEDEEGNLLALDGVLPVFNREDKGTFIKDLEMEVETIAGVPRPKKFPGTEKEWYILTDPTFDAFDMMRFKILNKYGITPEQIGIQGGGFWKKLKKTARKIGKGIKKAAKKVVNVAAKIFPVFVAGRLAFLTLVKNNYNGLASKLAQVFWKEPNKKNQILKKWKNFGGNASALENAINNGKGTGMINGVYHEGYGEINGPGLALLAKKAASIIKALLPFLKGLILPGAQPEEEQVEQLEKSMSPSERIAYEEELRLLRMSDSGQGGPPGYLNLDQKSGEKLQGKEGGDNTGMIIAVAALAFFMMKSK